ncbi:sirohydrochlorin chelatase [Tessaracoccus sp. Z1128]
MRPALVVCAHGTDDPDGQAAVLAIAAAVAERLQDVTVEAAYVDVQEPKLDVVVDRLVARGETVVVVPVLLTLGFHTEVDVRNAIASHPGQVVSTGPLGPDPRLEAALVDRLLEAGVPEDAAVVVGVAGSSRPEAADVGRGVARGVQERWAGPVTVGFLAKAEPTVSDAVTAARGNRPVALASYLIGHGFFQRRLARAGGDLLAEPIGAHPGLVDVVVDRYRSGCRLLDD